jgi:type IV pilus assembly protein PilM
MAAETGAVWAIDIGHNSLKALYLSTERGYVEVLGFDNIQHGKMLSSEDITEAERQELIALSLRKLVTTYDVSLGDIAISVPSQNSFIRFVNLPPVEAKRIPEMVRFEAVQQIPFDINAIQWDWQLMTPPDSPELKVGIFAIKNEVSNAALEPFIGEDIEVNHVQIAPMALYNFILHDRPELFASDNQAVVVMNIGATNTDIIVCTKTTVWQRCILIGGNNFTKAIADTFRLNFEKAEKLKRTAAMSKYARQIFQAMKPVFSELTSEIQRSLGFYNSANPNIKVGTIIAMGGGTKLRGLLKYMQQTLQISVERPDSFKKLALGSGVSQAKFHENVGDFGIVYGLALQALGLATIESNLLPRTVARSREWAKKGRYFIAAACMLLLVSLVCFAKAGLDKLNYDKMRPTRTKIESTLNSAKSTISKIEDINNRALEFDIAMEKNFELFQYRDVIAQLQQTIISVLPNEKNNPGQAALYQAFNNGNVEQLRKFSRHERKQIFITGISVHYTNDLSSAVFNESIDAYRNRLTTATDLSSSSEDPNNTTTGAVIEKGFVVTLIGHSPYGKSIADCSTIFDPTKVDDQKDKWGFVTRLGHLDELAEGGKSPFQLYKKSEVANFYLGISEVDLTKPLPSGIGRYDIRTGANNAIEDILIDPMTKEIMSKVNIYNTQGVQQSRQVNDFWFILKLKFIWKDAPVSAASV